MARRLPEGREQELVQEFFGQFYPPMARQALEREINLGPLLPCNAVVYEKDGAVWAGAVDAKAMLSAVGNAEMDAMADQVNQKLRRAVASLPAA